MSEDPHQLRKGLRTRLLESDWLLGNRERPFGRALIICERKKGGFFYTAATPRSLIYDAQLSHTLSDFAKPAVLETRDISYTLLLMTKREWDIIDVTSFHPKKDRLIEYWASYCDFWRHEHRNP
ncbi:MAG TPA: hypothetical protein VLJ21_04500 [Candidatus Binatia bacterium]|nr:hypothetical protein [Candidatus Binatia bacterium]